ncbi:MAG: carboxylating nicotinate-nucleotide diphosphorylase [Bacteroidota bacterium]|nr:carboxylating nicotinate-nucleotide diphosphorylase [Bacteroidota bacterium]|tara:strand:- start:1616 stop:2452 length:837 start_codon:yes stop_codon:yes gene_type:complete
MDNKKLQEFIENCIQEDIKDGDHTSICCIPNNKKGTASLISKENAIVAGVELAKKIFNYYDKDLNVELLKTDGQNITKEEIILKITGNIRSILAMERLVLNCMQRMSGIATKTRKIINLISDFNVKLLDTRKTTPNLRFLEKWAVKIGGGENHRMGLYDAILIKDNHIDYSKGITFTVKQAINYSNNVKKIPIIVEVRTIEELNQIISFDEIYRVILDNFKIDQIKKAVKIISKKFPIEVSGNITENNIKDFAATGVEFISMGALTHSVQNIDMSLKA